MRRWTASLHPRHTGVFRDYKLPDLIWGENNCEHEWGDKLICRQRGTAFGENSQTKQTYSKTQRVEIPIGSFCLKCSAWRGSLGLEPTPELCVQHLVEIFQEIRRVLKKEGTVWLNLGDSYANTGCNSSFVGGFTGERIRKGVKGIMDSRKRNIPFGLKPKDLVGIPWRCAFALQADGWWLRSDIVWCLSGGTWLYARTQKGDMPIMIRDVARLDPVTVQLWNGNRWTQVTGWSRMKRNSTELEIVLRSGERISCTPTHQFPTQRGLLIASALQAGDRFQRCSLPQPYKPKDHDHIGLDAAWLAGLYIAEGSMAGDTIQISGHAKEEQRWQKLRRIAASYGGSATHTVSGNKMDVRLYGKVLRAILDELVTGRTAHDKGLAPICWRYSNAFLRSLLDGYLAGDGHWDAKNKRWRLGFCRNYNLERDLRTLAARVGCHIILNLSSVSYNGKRQPTFRGELRFERSGHRNQKSPDTIVAIRKARCREIYDVGVTDEPHLLALASGVLTHNSKPNPMPESVTDRPTRSHEYIFLLSKSATYYFDQEAVREPYGKDEREAGMIRARKYGYSGKGSYQDWYNNERRGKDWVNKKETKDILTYGQAKKLNPNPPPTLLHPIGRNLRSVWHIPTQPFRGAHFATFPEKLIEPCIKSGCPEQVCKKCGKAREKVFDKPKWKKHQSQRMAAQDIIGNPMYRGGHHNDGLPCYTGERKIVGETNCNCNSGFESGVVLDPFLGSGTTAVVAKKLGRNWIGVELNSSYVKMAQERINNTMGLLI